MQDWLTLAEAAKLASEPRSTFDVHVREGHVPYAEVAGRRLFRTVDVEAYREVRHADQDEGDR